uniref:Rab-GAP TBC domain-containing protein n=1 Tax=Romanomermis culicivorax TaxID=13658 RepID=A0A915KUY1_ROMCU
MADAKMAGEEMFGAQPRLASHQVENIVNYLLHRIADNELYDVIQKMGDHAQFYFCYRWFLLDFKREFEYEDVFSVWETIWSANRLISENFDLFLALAMIETYRNDIIEECAEFSDIIKFFNEMAEKHDAKSMLENARRMLNHLQSNF